MSDARDEERKKRRLTVRFGLNGEKHIGYTCDVSSQGLYVESRTVYKPGTVLNLEITTSGGETILVEGKVCWAKKSPPNLNRVMKSGMGVYVQQFLKGEEVFRSFCHK